jgi:hypothetical protein
MTPPATAAISDSSPSRLDTGQLRWATRPRPGSPRAAAPSDSCGHRSRRPRQCLGAGPPEPLRSCWVPQSRHSRHRLPSGPRRRCQRWSRSLHRQGLAIAASWAMSRTGSMRTAVGPMRKNPLGYAKPTRTAGLDQLSVRVGEQRSRASAGRRRRRPGRRGAWISSQLDQRCDDAGREACQRSAPSCPCW